MANTYKNIVITPNTGSSTGDPTVVFSGGNTTVNTDITLRVYPDSTGTLSFEGSAGQLFSITNDLTGSLFSVNDVSGIPLIEVNVTSQQITFGEFYGNVGIGKSGSTSSTYKLDVNGTINASNILINGNAITGSLTSLTPANNWANTLSTSDRAVANAAANSANAYTVTVGTAGNNYTIQVGAASNTWANTLSTSDRAIANAAANSANAYTVTVGAAANAWANSLGVNTALAYTWTNTHTYQSTVSFSSNVFFRNTSNIVWITNASSTTSNVTLKTYPDSNGTLSFEGSAGQLFSITNDLTGSLFSVNDVSGIPLIEVNVTSQQITFGQFYGNVGIGTSNAIYKLDCNGAANIVSPTLLVSGTNVLASFAAVNSYSVTIGAASNTWANTVGTAGNNYTLSIGAASNTWANTLSTSDRAIANAAANSSNAYTIIVGAASNTWANSVNTYSDTTYFKKTGGMISGDVQVTGNLNIMGNVSFTNTNSVVVSDPLIYLAGNNYISDIVDIGIVANYVNATGSNVHTGVFRNAENKEWYVFQGYDQEPFNNHIDPNGNNFTLSVLNTNIRTSNLILGGANAIVTIQNNAVGANTWANTLYTSVLQNSNNSANSANAYTVTVGAASNTWANTVGTAGNNYMLSIATGINSNAVNNAVGANGWSNTLSTSDRAVANAAANSANAYTVTVGTAGNNYTNAVGLAGNNYMLSIATGINSNAVNNAVGANGWSNTLYTSALQNANNDANSSNSYAESVGLAVNNYTITIVTGVNSNAVNNAVGSNNWANSLSTIDRAIANSAANSANAYALSISGSGGVNVSTTGPTGNTNGSLWWNADVGRLLVYYNDGDSSQWVDANPVPPTVNTISISNYANSIGAASNTWANTKLANTTVTLAGDLTLTGNLLPITSNTRDLGSTTARWRNIYTGDLHLSNEYGDWTIVEGQDELFLYNNMKDKVYKFNLTEVDKSVAPPKKGV